MENQSKKKDKFFNKVFSFLSGDENPLDANRMTTNSISHPSNERNEENLQAAVLALYEKNFGIDKISQVLSLSKSEVKLTIDINLSKY